MDKGKTRILLIIDALGWGGTERRFVQLLKHLDRDEFEARVLVLTDWIHYREIFELGWEIEILDMKVRFDPLISLRLYRICQSWKPDIIHAWGSKPATCAGPVTKLLGIRLINAMIADAPAHLDLKRKIRSVLSFPFSDVIQANSRAGLEAYGVSGDKGNVVHNGFDFGRLENLAEKSSILEEFGIRTRYVVGLVQGFKYHKDYESLMEAASAILIQRDDVTFLCVGDGPEYDRIVDMADGNDRIVFTGERDDIESIVNVFDIGILLTNLERHGEGISNSIMEYMALAKAVIATRGGGTPEIVVDGETGFLIPQRSPGVLAEKINLLLDDQDLRDSMGKKGKERILAEFSIDSMVEGHERLYRALAADGGK